MGFLSCSALHGTLFRLIRKKIQQHGARLSTLYATFLDGLKQILESRTVTQSLLGEVATTMKAFRQGRAALAVARNL